MRFANASDAPMFPPHPGQPSYRPGTLREKKLIPLPRRHFGSTLVILTCVFECFIDIDSIQISTMADVVETTKVEEETPIKEVTKEVVPAAEAVVVADEKAETPAAEEPAKEGENGSAAAPEELKNGSSHGNGSTNGVRDADETAEETDKNGAAEPVSAGKRKSEGVEAADATDGVSAEKKAKLEEKSEVAAAEDGIEAPANGEAEVTA
ncbi:hypothetical protein Ocin01_03418 [Orchesella cincta]|uniref:Uncharacterized protein n=1 Tax=Orchesella cincta TaxID=48709 RepID=A0A1D2NDB6_ORCCI|nr:hypothetical protein Ocin01_03418 [Orchesella cincta]